jgi:hypothetical protein
VDFIGIGAARYEVRKHFLGSLFWSFIEVALCAWVDGRRSQSVSALEL